jgi:AraC-like DNA-binding protein
MGLLPTFSFATTNPDEFTERIAPVSGGSDVSSTAKDGFRASVRAFPLPRADTFVTEMAGARVFHPALPVASLTVAQSGAFQARSEARWETCGRRTAHFGEPAAEFRLRLSKPVRLIVLNFDPGVIDGHAAALVGGELRGRWWKPTIDLTTPEAASFLGYLRFFCAELRRSSSAFRVARIAREAEDLLAGLLVRAWLSGDSARDPAIPSSASLHLAEEFLAARLEEPVSVAEVARAAGTSVRSLYRAFQNKHGYGPVGFLRRQRLEAARRDLLKGAPGETSVTEVALRYGFAHNGRFAAEYRRCFGDLPSKTLRS